MKLKFRGAGVSARHSCAGEILKRRARRPAPRSSCLLSCLYLILFVSAVFAETLEDVQREIANKDAQITKLEKEYQQLKETNEELLKKKELGQAYAGAERLNRMNLQLNRLRADRIQYCERWRSLYRQTTDDLLEAAHQEKDRKKRGEIGKKLQEYQSRNAQLCAEAIPVAGSQEWRSVRIESYDGPREIQQKMQLLRDIERETRITLAKLENQHQDFLREQQTKERAQEFVQEGTLFDEGIAVRTATPVFPPLGSPGIPAEVVSTETPKQGPNTTAAAVTAWQSEQDRENFEAQYKESKAALLQQQKQLQEKIRELEQRAKALLIP